LDGKGTKVTQVRVRNVAGRARKNTRLVEAVMEEGHDTSMTCDMLMPKNWVEKKLCPMVPGTRINSTLSATCPWEGRAREIEQETLALQRQKKACK
jgi:hypothetical protein